MIDTTASAELEPLHRLRRGLGTACAVVVVLVALTGCSSDNTTPAPPRVVVLRRDELVQATPGKAEVCGARDDLKSSLQALADPDPAHRRQGVDPSCGRRRAATASARKTGAKSDYSSEIDAVQT